jgi:hypothetical protein
MPLASEERANVRFQIFETIMAHQTNADAPGAMQEAIILAQRLLCDDRELPSGSVRKGAASISRLSSGSRRRVA